jgi:hypothetical protein
LIKECREMDYARTDVRPFFSAVSFFAFSASASASFFSNALITALSFSASSTTCAGCAEYSICGDGAAVWSG